MDRQCFRPRARIRCTGDVVESMCSCCDIKASLSRKSTSAPRRRSAPDPSPFVAGDDAVAATVLGGAQALVGTLHEAGEVVGVLRAAGDAGTERDAARLDAGI